MKTKTKVSTLAATIILIGSLAGGANGTTVAFEDAFYQTGGTITNSSASARVGSLSFRGSVRYHQALAIFKVSDLILNEGLTVANIGLQNFNFGFITEDTSMNATPAIGNGSGSYHIDYLGFFANGNFPVSSFLLGSGGEDWWSATNAYNSAEAIDTGISAIKASQSVSISGFNLTGIVDDGNLSDDYVAFGVRYTEDPAFLGTHEKVLSSITLAVAPEPSSAMLLGIGGISLLIRRARKAKL